MEELDRLTVTIAAEEAPLPSIWEQLAPLIAMVVGVMVMGAMMGVMEE